MMESGVSGGGASSEVVASLQQMFPTLDLAVVQVVVEGCQNNMEKALDQLLEISAEIDSEAGAARQTVNRPTATKRWKYPLPDNFLSIEGLPLADTSSDVKKALVEALQNEQFVQELQQYEDLIPFLNGLSHVNSDALDAEATQVSNYLLISNEDKTMCELPCKALEILSDPAQLKLKALAARFKVVTDRQGGEYTPLHMHARTVHSSGVTTSKRGPSKAAPTLRHRKESEGTSRRETDLIGGQTDSAKKTT